MKKMHITPALALTILQKVLLMVVNFFWGGVSGVGMNPLKAELCFFLIIYLAPSSVPII